MILVNTPPFYDEGVTKASAAKICAYWCFTEEIYEDKG
jgi:hypothetical protein